MGSVGHMIRLVSHMIHIQDHVTNFDVWQLLSKEHVHRNITSSAARLMLGNISNDFPLRASLDQIS